MLRKFTAAAVPALFCIAFGQTAADGPKFEIADVHSSPKMRMPFARNAAPRGGRYEITQATMVDLIRIAYGFTNDKILGGPSWLELDRFDVVAKLPQDAAADDRQKMLQALLEDRFKLVTHKDTKPVSTYALVVGKKTLMKEADPESDKSESGCKPQNPSGAPTEGRIQLMTGGPNGPTTIILGPGMTIHLACRNMTMAAFASGLRGIFGVPNLGSNPVLDETGLKGAWNFDLSFSLNFMGPMPAGDAERVTFFDAIEKQLGLKLEEKPLPTSVLVVDSVNRKPTDNPPGVAEALPPVSQPKEFEVADIKPSDPAFRGSRFQTQPGGRVTAQGMPLRMLVIRAFNSMFNSDEIVGLPGWADTERYDITAKAASEIPQGPAMDNEALATMLKSLLVDRFKMTYHTEERQVTAYSLVAGKPKMKKADPNSRTSCKQSAGPGSAPPGQVMWTCQNITMDLFAEQLQTMGLGRMSWPVKNETGLEGSWDFTLVYSPSAGMNFGGRGGESAGPNPMAADPTGTLTLFEALEKQTGLKLEAKKRNEPVIVIDHLEQKPTEN